MKNIVLSNKKILISLLIVVTILTTLTITRIIKKKNSMKSSKKTQRPCMDIKKSFSKSMVLAHMHV